MADKIVLVAESGADIPTELCKEYGIEIVPMHLNIDGQDMDDNPEAGELVIDYYKRTGKVPKTSGSNVEDFNKVFERIHAREPEAKILYLAYSAATTVTFTSGCIAAQDKDYVEALDTKQCSASQCSVVIRTAELIRENSMLPFQKVVEAAKKICQLTHMAYVPKNLDFPRASGRVSNAMAIASNLLRIIPRINIVDGKLAVDRKMRGKMEKLVPKVIREFSEQYQFTREQLWLGYSPGFSEALRELATNVATELGFRKIRWIKTGGCITVHGGPGAFCIAGMESGDILS